MKNRYLSIFVLLQILLEVICKEIPPSIEVKSEDGKTHINVTCHPILEGTKNKLSINNYPSDISLNEPYGKNGQEASFRKRDRLDRFSRSINNDLEYDVSTRTSVFDSSSTQSTTESVQSQVPSVKSKKVISSVKETPTKKQTNYKKKYIKNNSNYNENVTLDDFEEDNITLSQDVPTEADADAGSAQSKYVIYKNTVANLDENSIQGSSNVHAATYKCGRTVLKKDSVSSDVQNLVVRTDGAILLAEDWSKTAKSLTNVRILASHGIKGISKCGWWPSNIEELDLSYMPLQYLNFTGCVSPPATLSSLVVVATNLSTIHLCAPALSSLDMSWNFLTNTSIQSACPKGLFGVEELRLNRNLIESWSSCDWSRIKYLDLSHNLLENIDLHTCPLDSVSEMKLSHNKLETFKGPIPDSLMILDIDHNSLTQLPNIPVTLKEGYFSHNKISSLDHHTFKFARRLSVLDLSHNAITVIRSKELSGLTDIRELDLSHNQIKHLGQHAFRNLNNLHILQIQNNKLNQVDPRLFSSLPQSVHITLHHNPWKCSCMSVSLIHGAATMHCGKHCKPKITQDLTCVESGNQMEVMKILTHCQRIMNDIRSRDQEDSDDSDEEYEEDDSLEDLTLSEKMKDSNSSSYRMAVPGVLSVLLFLVAGVLIHTLYKRRKKLHRGCSFLESYCDCLAPTRQLPGVTTLNENINDDSDVETEMTHMTQNDSNRTATTDL